MSDYHFISVTLNDYIGVITLDNAPYNFIHADMLQELLTAMRLLDSSDTCRVIVIGSACSVFCAGADFQSELKKGTDLGTASKGFYAIAMQLFDIATPMVAAIEGAAVGAGFGLTLLTDFRVCSPGATFSANFNRLGIHPGFGMSVTLPRIVGISNAELLFYTGKRIKGEEANRLGLITRLVNEGEVMSEALELAREIALSAPLAVRHTRETLRAGLSAKVREANKREQELQAQEMLTIDFQEGVAAAAERRLPEFKGA